MIQTFKDIKNALENVPDELLENLSFGLGEGCEEHISMIASEGNDEYDFPQVFTLVDEKYPQLKEFEKLVKNIIRAQQKVDDGNEEFAEDIMMDSVSSETFKKQNDTD
jgi:hypothetical protein